MKAGVYITFDVECSMGGAWDSPALRPVPPSRGVMGRYGDREYGLPLITDTLSQKGLAATFFVEAFMADQGFDGQGEAICEFLMDRGHDIQLHVHPNHKHFRLKEEGKPYPFTDMLSELSAAEQLSLISEGRERITRWTGRAPAAFRSGNMSISEESLKQLSAAGIHIDSSYSFPYVGSRCLMDDTEPYNGSRWYGDVLELALSGFTVPRLPGLKRAKPLDLVGISFEECREAIRCICGAGAGADAVLILHAHSLFKFRNAQYDGGRRDRVVARRFRRACGWLAEHSEEFPTYTFSDLADAIAENRYAANAVPPCRLSGVRAVMRKTVQIVNSIYWV